MPLPRVDVPLVVALLGFLGLVAVALLGGRLAPHESIYFVVEHGTDPRPYDPGLVFPFGSDVLGRDIFSLVLAGAGTTLQIVLLSGIARVAAGAAVAAAGSMWRPARLASESVAEVVSAVPATLVALVLVKILVRTETSLLVFIGALLTTGWAGPYRVIRAELDRLAGMPFTEGARAVGIPPWRLFWRHQLPHLVPVLALNTTQQVVASLVLVAELGVLGVSLGVTRMINIQESLSRVITGQINAANIPDPPEWGGLLASARTIESLYLTRWLIVVPGLAFAMTAAAVAAIGFALSRRYARRDLLQDLHWRRSGPLAVAVLAIVIVAGLVPERYAAAREWAADARVALAPSTDTAQGFAAAGLQPLTPGYAVGREISSVVRTAPAKVRIGNVTVDEQSSRDTNYPLNSRHVEALVTADTGGGTVDLPLVFVGRGITPSEEPNPPVTTLFGGQLPSLGALIKDYPDDWAGVDVHGKAVVLLRFIGVRTKPVGSRSQADVLGFPPATSIATAIRHGAAAVLLVDAALPLYTDEPGGDFYAFGDSTGGVNPYLRMEQESPAQTASGVPVVILSPKYAATLLTPIGVDIGPASKLDVVNQYAGTRSTARELGVTAHIEVPVERRTLTSTSFVGETPNIAADRSHALVWAIRRGDVHPTTDVLLALARSPAGRSVPFIFVDFDPSIDARGNISKVAEVLAGRRIGLVIVLDKLEGNALRFTTPYGDLIPAMDLYAEKAGARHVTTRATAAPGDLAAETAPFIDVRTVLVQGQGEKDDLRPDATAFLGYLAGRVALGAEELPR
jgi:peptide/nickel transport system permease protein